MIHKFKIQISIPIQSGSKIKIKDEFIKLQSGFTMVEMLIYMGLLTIFIGVLSTLFGSVIDIQFGAQSTTSVSQAKQYILTKLQYDAQRAQTIITPASNGISGSTMVLQIDNVNNTYSVDGDGDLVVTNNLGTFQLNNHNTRVNNVIFTKYGNVGGAEDTIRIDMIIESRILQAKGSESARLQTTLGLRRQQ